MSKDIIGIDARMISHSGIGVYLRNLLGSIAEGQLISKDRLRLFGDAGTIRVFFGDSFEVEPFSSKIYSVREQFDSLTKPNKVRLWHSPHYNIPLGFRGKLVVTVHDLTHYLFRKSLFTGLKRLYSEFMFRECFRRACAIIAVSENTKRDILANFSYPEDRIHVIKEGVGKVFRVINERADLEALRRYFKLPENFILYVGLVKPHKNVELLAKVVCELRRSGRFKEKLVIIGKKDSGAWEGIRSAIGADLDEHVIYINYVREEDLPFIYNMAKLFVMPSLYEGFGLTILEAFACGVPVLASNTSSIPEVASDAACLFDPKSGNELKEKLLALLDNGTLREELRRKGFERIKHFSWETMAQETVRLYKKVLGGT